MKYRMMISGGLGLALVLWTLNSTSSMAQGKFVSESIPHLPNFLGKNICLGIEAPADKTGWEAPQVRTTTRFGSEKAVHEIEFAPGNILSVVEDLVSKSDCAQLPLDAIRWGKSDNVEFCLKPWDGDKLIKVKISEVHSDEKSEYYVRRSIYAVGACKIGDGGFAYQYGEVLKVETIPTHVD